MNRNAILIAVALVACGVAAWLALDARDPAPAAAPSASRHATGAAAIATQRNAEAGEREAVAEPRQPVGEPGASEGGDLVVAVLHDGRPVAGAEVWSATALDEAELSAAERDELARLEPDPEAVLRRFGESATTGADGRAAIRPPPASHVRNPFRRLGSADYQAAWVVAARRGDLFGLAEIDSRHGAIEVDLQRDQALRVHVDDANGHPAEGVAIAWERRRGEYDGLGYRRLGATDANGDLPLAHSQRWTGGVPCAESRVMVHALGVDLPAREVDLARPVPSYIAFALPPTGQIRVVVEETDGTPYAGRCSVEIAGAGAAPSTPRFTPGSLSVAVESGEVVVPWVGLGQRFEARCRIGFFYTTPVVAFDGPARAGETVVHRIQLADQPSIEGRAFAPDHTPLSGTRLSVRVDTEQKTLAVWASTGDDGSFRAMFNARYRGVAIEELQIEEQGDERAGTGVVMRSPGPLVPGLDLGDVTLTDLPLLAAGRVVDAAGEPLSDFYVHTRAIPQEERGLAVRKPGDGRFEVRDSSAAKRLALRAVKTGYLDGDWQECVRGTTGLELVLRQAGRISATLDRPFDLAFMWAFRMSLTRVDEPGEPRLTIGSRVGERHFFGWSELEPGTYRLEGRLAGHRDPVVAIDDIEVHAGDNEDPRLRDIELPELRSVHLTLVDSEGHPFDKSPFGHLYVARDDDPSRFEETMIVQQARPVLLLRRASADIVVAASGFVPVRLRDVSEDVTVRLRKPLQVPITVDVAAPTRYQIAVRALAPDGPSETYLSTQGLPASPIPHATQVVALPLTPGATGELPLPGPGVYELDVSLRRGNETQVLEGFAPRVVSVERGSVPPPLKLTIPASAIPRER